MTPLSTAKPPLDLAPSPGSQQASPFTWPVLSAFAVVYLCWGTTYFAIKEGVKTLPPLLYSGSRLALAGFILLAIMRLRGTSLRVTRRDFLLLLISGGFLFIGGNGLLTIAQTSVDSGLAAVLISTTPLWMALLERMLPFGDRLSARGWLGLGIGLAGVIALSAGNLPHVSDIVRDPGVLFWDGALLLTTGSSISWAIGSLIYRYGGLRLSPFLVSGYQMFLGGVAMCVLGLGLGEAARLTPGAFTTSAVVSFFYLLLFGSLLGFVAYNYLLSHVSTALASTYSYVNPVIALLVGAWLANEPLTGATVIGMVIILMGVALVRGSMHIQPTRVTACQPDSIPRHGRIHGARPSVDATCK